MSVGGAGPDGLYEVEPDGSIILAVLVQPGASRGEVVGRHGAALKVKVTAPPEAGKANVAVLALLAKSLGLRRSDVALLSGASSRSKRVRLCRLPEASLRRWLAARG